MITRSLYFEDRAEYFRRKLAGLEYKIQVATQYRAYKTYFTNFVIAESQHSGVWYVQGSLSSPKKIPMAEAQSIIRANCPAGYTPVEFYEAVEHERQDKTIFVLMREGEEILESSFNV